MENWGWWMRDNCIFDWCVLISLGITPGTNLDYSRMCCKLPYTETKLNGELGEDRELGEEGRRLRIGVCYGSWNPCDLGMR
jgi:hypothetical protein